MGGLNNKGEAGLVIIIILVIVVFFFGWLINVSQRECKSNRDCISESYCGSDFSCHTYPNIQKTVVQYNLFWPAVVIGIAIIIAALIFRRERIIPEKTIIEHKIERVPEEPEDNSYPYYKNSEPYYKGNTKTP